MKPEMFGQNHGCIFEGTLSEWTLSHKKCCNHRVISNGVNDMYYLMVVSYNSSKSVCLQPRYLGFSRSNGTRSKMVLSTRIHSLLSDFIGW